MSTGLKLYLGWRSPSYRSVYNNKKLVEDVVSFLPQMVLENKNGLRDTAE
jgi:hypothetical protein